MSKPFFINQVNFLELLKHLSGDYDVFVPVKKGRQRFYQKFPFLSQEIVIGEVRAFEPLKAFFSRAREVVAQGFQDTVPPPPERPLAIVGVKACDLKGFKIQDFVFYPPSQKTTDFSPRMNAKESGLLLRRDVASNGEADNRVGAPEGSEDGSLVRDHELKPVGLHPEGNKDPIYARNRERNLVISADCTCAIDTCYCLAMNVQPHPQEDFDINLSQVANGFVVSVGSPKGEAVVRENAALFEDASSDMLAERDATRRDVIRAVEKNLRDFNVPMEQDLPGVVERNFHSKIWEDEARTCVECGACNTICPTCHCFLLYDQKAVAGKAGDGAQGAGMERFRIWDSCLIKDFARVAGGANPRARLWMRLRNRFEKKFDFFPKVSGVTACTGCGRCISACPAKIDIRKVLRRLVNNE